MRRILATHRLHLIWQAALLIALGHRIFVRYGDTGSSIVWPWLAIE